MNKNTDITITEETIGDIKAEIIPLDTPDGARIVITRIKPVADTGTKAPVILLHGSYSKRNFWISPKGIGFGRFLAEKGFDVWIPELRGHGLSPKDENYSRVTAEDQIRHDIPAVNKYVAAETGRRPFWTAHSFGGLFLLFSLAAGWIPSGDIAGAVVLGSQLTEGEKYLKIPPVAWLVRAVLRITGYFPAPRLGLGPEIEPASTIIEIIKWKALFGRPITSEGFNYWDGFPGITVPVLAFAGAADTSDPAEGCRYTFDRIGSGDKKFVLLGKSEGFSMDYGHIEMIVSKEARTEVWPLITDWIETRHGAGLSHKFPPS